MNACEFYPELCQRYIDMVQVGEFAEGVDTKEHLLWMLLQLQTDLSQSLTKKHRWLGYIQHAVIAEGLTTVMLERDHTRNIFSGA